VTLRLVAALLVVAFASIPRASTADTLDHIEPRFTGGTDDIRARCDHLVQDASVRQSRDVLPTTVVGSCLDLVRAQTTADERDTGSLDDRADDRRHRELLASFLALRILELSVNAIAKADPASGLSVGYRTAVNDLRARLDTHSLSGSRLAAIAAADLVRADPGGYTGQPASAPNQGLTTARIAASFETDHVAIGRGWDVSLDVDAAWQPLFAMVKPASAAAVTPAYVNGLSLATGPRIAHASRSTEIAATGFFGAARLPATTFTVGRGDDEHTVAVAMNDIAEWALAFGGGLDFRWYTRDVWQTHLTNQTLLPLLRVAGGLTHDQRFRRDGDLEPYNDPTGRVYFAFDVHPLQFKRGSDRSGAPVLTIGGGFQFETALVTTERLPSGYKVFASGRFDLMTFRRPVHMP
jgi:hypothetical protein